MDNKTKKYTYLFANGERVIVNMASLNDGKREWVEILMRLDLDEQANNKKESRRHCSIDACNPEREMMRSAEDPEMSVLCKDLVGRLLVVLTEREKEFFLRKHADGYSMKEISSLLGVNLKRVYQIDAQIKRKFKKVFKGV